MKSSGPEITHLGAGESVTGSCHLMEVKGLKILVDCGLPQGKETAFPMESWPISAQEIDYVFVTHAHIDHIGRIPELVMRGFKGEIIASHPTVRLVGPMLEDAMGFSGMDESEIPKLKERIEHLLWGFEYGEDFDLKEGIQFRMKRAGHVLGSSFIRFTGRDPDWSVLFSGDIGTRDKPIIVDPEPPDHTDLLILESTYGDTVHQGRDHRIERLGGVLSRALADGGKVFIPAFALERTQEILFEMDRLVSAPELKEKFPGLGGKKIPVFLDSPLGQKLTQIYTDLNQYWDNEARQILRAGDNPLDFSGLYGAMRFQDHLKILELAGPAVVIAGSGMCTGGRIVDHLKAGLNDPRNDVLFVGYQAEGTPGRLIVEFAEKPDGYVVLDGERVSIQAKVHVLPGYSGHADQKELVEWVQSMPEKPQRIRLVHGEPSAKKALAQVLQGLGYEIA